MSGIVRWRSLALAAVLFCVPTVGAAGTDPLPNLVPLPPSEIRIVQAEPWDLEGPQRSLRFTVAVANRGPRAFELLSIAEFDPETVMSAPAEQCIGWLEVAYPYTVACSERVPVGRVFYHQEHSHWHVEDFVAYELRRLTAEGDADFSESGLVGASKKVSFCLVDAARDPEPPHQDSPQHSVVVDYGCATGTSMGISPGWMDVYDWSTYDQFLSLDGVTDGEYALVVHANPVGRFIQSRSDDDAAWTRVGFVGGTLTTPA